MATHSNKNKNLPAKTDTATKRTKGTNVGLSVTSPELWRFDWVRAEESQQLPDGPLPLSFKLGIVRPSENCLGIELSVALEEVPGLRAEVAYRAEFRVENGGGTPDVESIFRSLVVQLAPATLYPFIRETISSAAVKSGLSPIVLPVINFRDFFDPEEVYIPPFKNQTK